MEQELRSLAEKIKPSKVIVVLTGAGASKESGIPTFRDKDGLWSQYDMERFASLDGLLADPRRVWEWYRDRYLEAKRAQPNPGHKALAEIEALLRNRGKDFAIITQNIDGLHQKAGSENVIEIHGSLYRAKCMECGKTYAMDDVINGSLPPYCECGGLIRPDVVFFGEPLPEREMEMAIYYAQNADVFITAGTSAVVYPAASLPYIAKDAGAVLVEVNVEDTPLTPLCDFVLRGRFGEVLPRLYDEIKNSI